MYTYPSLDEVPLKKTREITSAATPPTTALPAQANYIGCAFTVLETALGINLTAT